MSKLVPLIVSEVPASADAGEKLVIVGARLADNTTYAAGLDALPAGAVTPTRPVVAPVGTVTTNSVAVAVDTVAAVPLNETLLRPGVVENPLP